MPTLVSAWVTHLSQSHPCTAAGTLCMVGDIVHYQLSNVYTGLYINPLKDYSAGLLKVTSPEQGAGGPSPLRPQHSTSPALQRVFTLGHS